MAIDGAGAVVENDPGGPLATINAAVWLLYCVWMAALSIALMRARAVRTS